MRLPPALAAAPQLAHVLRMTGSLAAPAQAPLPDDRTVDHIAEIFAALALEAGQEVMRIYNTGTKARLKADHSPVCQADENAEALLVAALHRLLPDYPVIAEEAVSQGRMPETGRAFILVDPLDGTREFLARNGEFTINLALIVDGVPRAGVVYAPALDRLWFAGTKAFSCTCAPGAAVPPMAERQLLHARIPGPDGLVALTSRSHGDDATEALLARLPIAGRTCAGSSLKFCLIAEGSADIYPRSGPTMEWDIAAGDAVLRAAGGMVVGADDAPMQYGKRQADWRNGPFVAWGVRAA